MSETKEIIQYLRVQAPDTSTSIIGIESLQRYVDHNNRAKRENKKYYFEIVEAEAKYDKVGNLIPVQPDDVTLVKIAEGSAKTRYVSKSEVLQLNSKLLKAEDELGKKDDTINSQAEEIAKLRAEIAAANSGKKDDGKKDETGKGGKA